MKKKWYLGSAVLLAATGLIAASAVYIGNHSDTETQSSVSGQSGSDVQQKKSEKEYRSSALEDKSETVYAKADAEGNVTEITVEAILKNPGGSEPIPDCSTLHNIRNTKGDEEYTQKEDGTILWDNHGEDIYYKGTSDTGLPVSVKISYYLDGRPVSPKEIAGRSGNVRIRFDYENHTSETVEIAGKEQNVPIPFTAFSAILLPSDTFCNVEVTNGKIITMDEQNMVIGYACPGLSDSLKLSDYEPTEDVEIPDYVEITADAEEFELEFTATVISSGLLEDLETEDLDDTEDLIDDMAELTDASKELVDGTGELYDGVVELEDGIKEYTDGVGAVDEGVSEVRDALDMLDDQKTPLREGASALQAGLEALDMALGEIELPADISDTGADDLSAEDTFSQLAENLGVLSSSLASLQESLSEAGEIPEELNTMAEAITDMKTQMEALAAYSEGLSGTMASALPSLKNVLDTLKDGVAQLTEGSKQLSEGVYAYTHGVSELYRGSLELSDGTSELAEAGDELKDGLTELVDGVQELKDGVKEFDEEGIQELTELAGDDLENILHKVRALKEADNRCINFSGIREGQTGSVKFIIETEAISD